LTFVVRAGPPVTVQIQAEAVHEIGTVTLGGLRGPGVSRSERKRGEAGREDDKAAGEARGGRAHARSFRSREGRPDRTGSLH